MYFKKILDELIEEEISLIEQAGEKVKLKTLFKRRVLYTMIFGAIFAVLIIKNSLFLAFVDLVIYFIVLYNKANNASVITALAKKSPDSPIADVIKGDMK